MEYAKQQKMKVKNNIVIFFIFIFLFLDLAGANNVSNTTTEEENKTVDHTFCIVLLDKKEDVDIASVGLIGGFDEFAWATYGSNPYFSWINIPKKLSAPVRYGCRGAQAISSGIPLEVVQINNSIKAYGITIHDFPLEKYVNVEMSGHYLLLNNSVENLYGISTYLCSSKNSEINWYIDEDSSSFSPKPRRIIKRPEFSFKWDMDENDKEKILEYLSLDTYLFNWDDVSESNSKEILDFLKYHLEHRWIENAEIKKSNDNKTITITKGQNSIKFNLKKDENKVVAEIHGGLNVYEYLLKEENGRLNVYEEGNKKILKTKDNKNIVVGDTYLIELRENEAVLKRTATRYRAPMINLSENMGGEYIKTFLNRHGYENSEIIKMELLDDEILFVNMEVKFEDNSTNVLPYLLVNNDVENTSYIYGFIDISKFEVRNESGEIKIYEFETPYQYIDAFYTRNYTICFGYSDDGKEGDIKFGNKTINWGIKESIENESCENNTLKITLEGGKDIRFFPFLITKKIIDEENETLIYGILIPCNLSEIYSLELETREKMDNIQAVLFHDGLSFSSMFKIATIYFKKNIFRECNDTKKYTLKFKFSENFNKEDIDKIKVIITKILPEDEPWRNGRTECIEKEMKCYY